MGVLKTSSAFKKSSTTTEPSSFISEDRTTNDIAHHFYSQDGKVLALVKKIKSANDAPAPAEPTEPVKLAPSGLPPVSGPPVAETRCIEMYDATYANGATEPAPLSRVPPNAGEGIFGVEDHVYFSPLARYLVTWQPIERLKKGEGNLKVWDVKTGRMLLAFEHPSRQSWPVLRWTPNERIMVRLNQGQLTAFDWHEFATSPAISGLTAEVTGDPYEPLADATTIRRETLREQAITEFSVTHSAVGVFVPERKGMPAKVMIIKLNDFSDVPTKYSKPAKPAAKDQPADPAAETTAAAAAPSDAPAVPSLIVSHDPIASKSFYRADDVNLNWHARGVALLVLASTIQDTSGKNYYGDTSLYYLQADGTFDCNVVLDKQGPVHSVAWNPKGNGDFAVTYGYMPASTALFDRKCRPTAHLGSASRNTLVWSPHGRVLVVGGFFALSGEMDFWDVATLSKLGTCRAYCSSSHVWSPDGRYLMASVLWPRMRVDNGIKIFSIFGQLVWSSGSDLKELWQANWQNYIVNRSDLYTYPKNQIPIKLPDIYPDVDFDKILVKTPGHEAGVGKGSPTPGAPKADAAAAKAPAKTGGGAYKHPHWSGRSAGAMSHQQATDGPQKVQSAQQQRGPVGGQLVGGTPAKTPVGGQLVGGTPASPKTGGAGGGKRNKKKPAGSSEEAPAEGK